MRPSTPTPSPVPGFQLSAAPSQASMRIGRRVTWRPQLSRHLHRRPRPIHCPFTQIHRAMHANSWLTWRTHSCRSTRISQRSPQGTLVVEPSSQLKCARAEQWRGAHRHRHSPKVSCPPRSNAQDLQTHLIPAQSKNEKPHDDQKHHSHETAAPRDRHSRANDSPGHIENSHDQSE